jgi:hypothetical protein
MSEYFDEKDLFMEPKTKQYGSHMVMTNVYKEKKTKYINVDSRFRDDSVANSNLANYTLTLPQRITDVKTIEITNIEIPDAIFNISQALHNNSFTLTNVNTNAVRVVSVPDNRYFSMTSLTQAVNNSFTNFDASLNIAVNANGKCIISSKSNAYNVSFSVDEKGNFDRKQLNSKLGWILGFRNIKYALTTSSSITAEAFPDTYGPKYLYLAIDEFARGNQNSFISPLPHSIINKNIIARISMTNQSFGQLISANRANGSLVSDTRSYAGKVDLQKLNIQILNEYGDVVTLNGLDFSFCIEVEHE